jgi:hypothetical protein
MMKLFTYRSSTFNFSTEESSPEIIHSFSPVPSTIASYSSSMAYFCLNKIDDRKLQDELADHRLTGVKFPMPQVVTHQVI